MLIQLFVLSLIISVCAFVYCEILTDSQMILFKWRGFLFRVFKGEDHWLFKILIGCSYCVAGQWSLWIYFYIIIFGSNLFDKIEYDVFMHLALVMFSIFNVAIIKRIGIYGTK